MVKECSKMKTVEKRASELLKFFATISLILVTVGCVVFPMLEQILTQTNGITLAGILVCIGLYIMVIMMTSFINKLPKSVQSPTKKLVMRALIFIIGLHSVFLFLVVIAYSIYLSKTSNTIQINTGVQILSATSLSIFLCMFFLSYFTVGKNTKVKDQIVIKDSFVKAYTGAVMVLISILVSCCVFESVFVMKNKTGFITWFGEIISVIFDGTSSFGDSFVIEPFGTSTLSNLYALIQIDSTPLYIAGALLLLLLAVPIKETCQNISKEIKELIDDIKGIIRNSEKPALLKRRLNHPMWGFCPNCGKRVRLILFTPYDRTKIVFDEDKIIDNAIELLVSFL